MCVCACLCSCALTRGRARVCACVFDRVWRVCRDVGVVGEVDSAARDCPTVRVDRTTPPPSHEMGKMGRKGK